MLANFIQMAGLMFFAAALMATMAVMAPDNGIDAAEPMEADGLELLGLDEYPTHHAPEPADARTSRIT